MSLYNNILGISVKYIFAITKFWFFIKSIFKNTTYHVSSRAFKWNRYLFLYLTKFKMRVGGMRRSRQTVEKCARSRYYKTNTRYLFLLISQVASNDTDVITFKNSALLYSKVVLFVSIGCNQPLCYIAKKFINFIGRAFVGQCFYKVNRSR